MTYENLLIEADSINVMVKEKPLTSGDGLCFGNRIAISNKLKTDSQRTCVLVEELGHFHKTVGNITDSTKVDNIKQEAIARQWGYKKLVGILDIIRSFEHGARDRFEMAEYLNVTEEFLDEALTYYKRKYGIRCEIDNYIVFFEPNLGILKMY